MPGEQLRLDIPAGDGRRLPERLVPMQPSPGPAPFDDPGMLFEPWWPGIRALAFVERGELRLQAEGLADATRAFAELGDELPAQLMTDAVILDGTLLVLDARGRLDAGLLKARLAGARLVGRPAFVATDLLWCDGQSWTRRRYAQRRERLGSVLTDGDRAVVGRAFRRDGTLLAEALGTMGIAALSAHRLDARYRAGAAGDAWLRIPILAAEPTDSRPSLALIQRLPLEVG